MTINPNDPDIKENLPKGVPAHYMPHLVTRVAYLKFKRHGRGRERGYDLYVAISFEPSIEFHPLGKVFGKVISWTYVIEFQKRGLPHIHALLTLDSDYKWRTPEGKF